MKKIIASTVGERFDFKLPPGEYLIGDPCYILSPEVWEDLLEIKWYSEFPDDSPGKDSNLDHNIMIETDNGLIVTWPTQVGDGTFTAGCNIPGHYLPPLKIFGVLVPGENNDIGAFGVDSGNLSIVSKPVAPNVVLASLVGSFTLIKETEFWIDEYSNLANEDESLDILVFESPEEEEEEEEEESDE